MIKADLILKSENIFDSVSDYPYKGSIAIKDGKIINVCDGEIPSEYLHNGTKIMDYEDKMIMTSFIDAHDHIYSGIINLSDHMCSDLIKSTSEAECIKIIKEYADSHPNEKRIRGCGWFPANWGDAALPTKKSLDAVIPDRPVYLMSADSHTCWLNSKAIEEVGVSTDWDLKTGVVGVGEDGKPNGLLIEPEAFKPAMAKMIDFTKEEFEEIMQEQLQKVVELGVTTMSDMSAYIPGDHTDSVLEQFKEFNQSKGLPLRIFFYMALDGNYEYEKVIKYKEKYNDNKIEIGGLKGFIDGVTSTFTGYLLEPYEDNPGEKGINCPMIDPDKGSKMIAKANKLGLPVRLHCIGDAAVRQALDMYEYSIKENGELDINNSVEHIEVIAPEDMCRFKELGVIASMQPAHLPLDMNEKITRCGMKRSKNAWNHKSLLDKGAVLAFGTDFPIVGLNPFENIYAAVTRCYANGMPTGTNPWECISVSQAIKAYTIGSACAYNKQDVMGSIEVGKYADLIVLDKNIFDIDYDQIRSIKPIMTMVNGEIVYER